MNIKDHALFPTHSANNLECESQSGFFFLWMLSPLLEVFPVQLQPPTLPIQCQDLQNMPILHTLPVCGFGFFAGQLSGAKGAKHFSFETYTTILNRGRNLRHSLLKVKIWFTIFSTHIFSFYAFKK